MARQTAGSGKKARGQRVSHRGEVPRRKKGTHESLEALLARVAEVSAPALAAEGLEFLAVRSATGSGAPLVRILVDKPGGVGIGDLTHASRHLGDLLDVAVDREAPYRLEVSSPGPDRPLVTPDHFRRFLGKTAKVRTREPASGRKSFTGAILDASGEAVFLEVDGVKTEIPFGEIESARLAGS